MLLIVSKHLHIGLIVGIGNIPFRGLKVFLQGFVFEYVTSIGKRQVLEYAALLRSVGVVNLFFPVTLQKIIG